jgi:MoaA/NifB/PqqE/SkfB family radical SAM enzyme
MSAKYPGTSSCELSSDDKHKLLEEIIDNGSFSIDFSGGEPLLDKATHYPLIQRASQALGKVNVGLSCSGAYIHDFDAAFIAEYCGDVELTLDCAPSRPYKYRPPGYHARAHEAAKLLKAHGATVGLQTVATTANTNPEMWTETYQAVCDAGADEWSILRYQLCGRGENYPELYMSAESCAELVRRTKKMDKENTSPTKPKVSFSYLMPGHDRYADACRCVKKSVGVIGNRVLSCFWGIDKFGELYDQRFLLGRLPDQSFGECITGENAQHWMANTSLCQLCDTCASAA